MPLSVNIQHWNEFFWGANFVSSPCSVLPTANKTFRPYQPKRLAAGKKKVWPLLKYGDKG
jgi:hypothetical protein